MKQVFPKFCKPTIPFFARVALPCLLLRFLIAASYCALHCGRWNLSSFYLQSSSQYLTSLQTHTQFNMFLRPHHSHLPNVTRSYFVYLNRKLGLAISTRIASVVNSLSFKTIDEPMKGSKLWFPGHSIPELNSTFSSSISCSIFEHIADLMLAFTSSYSVTIQSRIYSCLIEVLVNWLRQSAIRFFKSL